MVWCRIHGQNNGHKNFVVDLDGETLCNYWFYLYFFIKKNKDQILYEVKFLSVPAKSPLSFMRISKLSMKKLENRIQSTNGIKVITNLLF